MREPNPGALKRAGGQFLKLFGYILLPLESWGFALAEGASSHPTRPGSSFTIVNLGGADANLPTSALANSPTFKRQQYIPVLFQSAMAFRF